MVELIETVPTSKYSVHQLKGQQAQSKPSNSLKKTSELFTVNYSKATKEQIKERYLKDGFCIYKNLFSSSQMKAVKKTISKIVNRLINCYDEIEDEFVDFDKEENNIVRMPRIGRGKHNIHFDPEFSEQHETLSNTVTESGILDTLSFASDGTCSLRECGISITRPSIQRKDNSADMNNGFSSGEGIEWHSDGAKGEFTMLLSYEDIESERGSVRHVPGSHLEYVEGVGFDEVTSFFLFFPGVLDRC